HRGLRPLRGPRGPRRHGPHRPRAGRAEPRSDPRGARGARPDRLAARGGARHMSSAVDDSRTLGRSRLSFASEADIDEFVETLRKFESGELGPDRWRAFRLVRGTYGQRQEADAQMLRVKIPMGALDGGALRALAD